ncbi:ABC transporter permease [Flavobacteriaceae bacterium S0825]|uniref:ABC transporter permease n=1 Tax=Gaetbulibacter sp. S0825 TaxID=2720084 RepID=UPI0014301E96|nr:ABC transporter permease [Gaetbulibacter sp. S0825]MCK0109991.1 ABC transporter permease [Flavobacteriaceae bacterium S0825]NIX65620.1 FtsX-like permease family protein [Gaetbulibacter sp. S0825]
MIKNYFKIAWRNLIKNKGFTAINIIGLSMGIGCFIMISMFVIDELNYDRHHEKVNRIYRVNSDVIFGGTEMSMAVSSDPMGEVLMKDYPEVENYVRFYASNGSKLIKKGNEYINESAVAHADSTLFDVFTLSAIIGDTKTALSNPNTVVITETAANRYFGSPELAIGQLLETDDNQSTLYKVTAVIEDIPRNSHFNFDFFFSMANVDYGFGNYLSHNFHTYVLLKEGANYKAFNKNFKEVINKYLLPQAAQFMEISSMDDFEASGNKLEYSLMPLTDIHLHSSRGAELSANGNIQYVYIFSAAALFILLIACINFMNLTTARSSGRAKEVGIRKVLGSEKKALIGQFLTESTLIAVLALFVGLLFVWLSLGWFNGVSGKEMSMASILSPKFLIFILILPFIVGGLAGTYPAFFLSSFQPIKVLKGKLSSGSNKNTLRNFLVVFQFATSIILIVGTIVIYKQINHIQNSNLGFNKEQVVVVNNFGLSRETRQSLKNEIEQLTEITSASFAGYLPVGSSSRSDTTFSTETVMTESNGFNMQYWNIDYDYLETIGMEMEAGRNFSRDFGSDSTGIILNETAVKLAGFTNPIGKKLYTTDGDSNLEAYTIIGVVKNFNFASLRENVGALCFQLGNNSWETAYRFSTTDVSGLLATIENKYKAAAPGMPFNYEFLDEAFDNMYRQERRVGKVAMSFAILAIIIACLGLFGLATYIAEQRTKEIGIRKVLGASVTNIVKMLSTDFVKLVMLAFVIATPIAWWFMDKWLQDFAFRIDLNWWIFAITGFVALLVALITLSFQAIRAAIANPVNSLKTE